MGLLLWLVGFFFFLAGRVDRLAVIRLLAGGALALWPGKGFLQAVFRRELGIRASILELWTATEFSKA